MPKMPILARLPDAATVRVFHAARPLDGDEIARLARAMDAFVAGWVSHEAAVAGAWELVHGRFLVVAADESRTHLSGCSKDSSVNAVRSIETAIGVEFVSSPPVVWREGDAIRCAGRDEFAELAAAGNVDLDTIVFDNTVTTLGDLRHGRWETRARDSWHARAFDFAARP